MIVCMQGVEISPELFAYTEAAVRKFAAKHLKQKIELTRGNVLDYEWTDDADFVLLNASGFVCCCFRFCFHRIHVCLLRFDEHVMKHITEKCQKLKAGALVVSVSKELESPYCEMVINTTATMTWGPTKVYVYQRVCLYVC